MLATIRPATRGEIERAAIISCEALQSPSLDPYLNSFTWVADNYGLDFVIVAEVDGKLVSSLVCTPGQVMMTDDVVPLCAIGGVATMTEYRRFGYAGLMMEESVRTLARHGYHTSALWPFSYHYYRKYGWDIASEQRRYVIPSELAAEMASPEGVRPAVDADLPGISRLVDRFARRHNCVSVRDDKWWSLIKTTYSLQLDANTDLRTSHAPWVHESHGQIDAYAFFRIAGEGDDEQVDIREIIADTSAARAAVLSHLATAGVPHIGFDATLDDGFLQGIPNPRMVDARLQGGFQLRVIDPVAAFEARTAASGATGRLGLEIEDPTLGLFDLDLEIADGKFKHANSKCPDRLRTDIQTFAQLYAGYLTATRAAELGKVAVASDNALRLADSMFEPAVSFRSHLEIG
jgi:predicted acetyltransferase